MRTMPLGFQATRKGWPAISLLFRLRRVLGGAKLFRSSRSYIFMFTSLADDNKHFRTPSPNIERQLEIVRVAVAVGAAKFYFCFFISEGIVYLRCPCTTRLLVVRPRQFIALIGRDESINNSDEYQWRSKQRSYDHPMITLTPTAGNRIDKNRFRPARWLRLLIDLMKEHRNFPIMELGKKVVVVVVVLSVGFVTLSERKVLPVPFECHMGAGTLSNSHHAARTLPNLPAVVQGLLRPTSYLVYDRLTNCAQVQLSQMCRPYPRMCQMRRHVTARRRVIGSGNKKQLAQEAILSKTVKRRICPSLDLASVRPVARRLVLTNNCPIPRTFGKDVCFGDAFLLSSLQSAIRPG
ncbi:unnamed protein product [Nesidiocoris tenuis]|uniref:Uncharacterized protein n=1 Tax=Nesidiocoris tenuis TaxID=355587 RepID=A0A6H5G4P1_9HEMI|nr:unnamed protein product [Nesidiocoris tenuis]